MEIGSQKLKWTSNFEELDKALFGWFQTMCLQDAIINGPLMLEKAHQLVNLLECDEQSESWLDWFKEKHKIKFKNIDGEIVVADEAGAKQCIE